MQTTQVEGPRSFVHPEQAGNTSLTVDVEILAAIIRQHFGGQAAAMLGASDAKAYMEDACRRMALVAQEHYADLDQAISIDEALFSSDRNVKLFDDPVKYLAETLAADIIRQQIGVRVASELHASRRMTQYDAWYYMVEASRKMARVALRTYSKKHSDQHLSFLQALVSNLPDEVLFPNTSSYPGSGSSRYLIASLFSVKSDAEDKERLQIDALPLSTPISDNLSLADIVPDTRPDEERMEQDREDEYRRHAELIQDALEKVLTPRQTEVMILWKEKLAGKIKRPFTNTEKVHKHNATKAIRRYARNESPDTPIRDNGRNLKGKSAHRMTVTDEWDADKQKNLFQKLWPSWKTRSHGLPEGVIDEAVPNLINDSSSQPPTEKERELFRSLDLWDNEVIRPYDALAKLKYEEGVRQHKAGALKQAEQQYRAALEIESKFYAGWLQLGLLYAQMGEIPASLKINEKLVRRTTGFIRSWAAANAADDYMAYFDSGRNQEHNIERAIHFAKIGVEVLHPIFFFNLILAYSKDRRYLEGTAEMRHLFSGNYPPEFIEDVLQIFDAVHDPALKGFLVWFDNEVPEEGLSA